MRPLDLTEWLESYGISSDCINSDFAREALELVGNVPFYDECIEIREALEKEVLPEKFTDPERLIDYFIDRSQLLDELEDSLAQAGFAGDDISKSLDQALAELEEVKTKLAALTVPAVVLPDGRELEYDL